MVSNDWLAVIIIWLACLVAIIFPAGALAYIYDNKCKHYIQMRKWLALWALMVVIIATVLAMLILKP